MSDQPLDRLPEEIRVPLSELRAVMGGLEDVQQVLRQTGQGELAMRVDAIVGRMSRWVWPLLGELGEGHGYDE